jgi:hypothetical protein
MGVLCFLLISSPNEPPSKQASSDNYHWYSDTNANLDNRGAAILIIG